MTELQPWVWCLPFLEQGVYCTVSELQHSKCQKSIYFASPVAFSYPDGGVPLERPS